MAASKMTMVLARVEITVSVNAWGFIDQEDSVFCNLGCTDFVCLFICFFWFVFENKQSPGTTRWVTSAGS